MALISLLVQLLDPSALACFHLGGFHRCIWALCMVLVVIGASKVAEVDFAKALPRPHDQQRFDFLRPHQEPMQIVAQCSKD